MTQSTPIGAGKSSFELIDSTRLFRELYLRPGMTILDLACGKGAYSLVAAERVGAGGSVYAVDLWEDGIVQLKSEAVSRGIENIEALVGDAGRHIPIEDGLVDVCLMATVLHDFVGNKVEREVMAEIVRVIKPRGVLAIVEFYKKEGPPGPPKPIRLSPQEVDKILSEYGFKQNHLTEIGPDNYLQIFMKNE